MKELTIEQKAEAYDKAINAIKELKEKHPSAHVIKDWIKENFPELAESEDERIRKDIVTAVETYGDFTQGRKEEIYTWLEKQGEQKPADKVEPKFKVGDTVTVKPMSCHGKVFKGEPFKIVDIIEDNYVSDDGKTYGISLQDGWELVQQNPAWSEEDDNCLSTIIAEFSKCSGKSVSKDEWMRCNDFLNSLKDRYTWKPSEEQLEALEHSLGDYNIKIFEDRYEILKSLYQDLKRIREE